MAQFLSLVDSLPNSENKIETLNHIKTCIWSMQPGQIREMVRNISFNVIFEYLHSDDKQQVDVTSSVLERLLSSCESTTLLDQFHDEVLQGLHHSGTNVKELCLKQVLSASNSAPQQVTQYSDIVCTVVDLLSDDSLDVAKLAMKILVNIGSTSDGLECIIQGNGFEALQRVIRKGDTVRYRVFEVVVDISKLSRESLLVCESSGLLEQLLRDLKLDDVLVQLNALELLTQLASTPHGLQYLEQKGVLNLVEQMLLKVETDPLLGFLLPGLLKFFGHIGYRHPKEISGRLQPFMNAVFSNLDSADTSLKTIAIETLGYVGSSPEGKLALEKQGNKMTEACRNIGSEMRNSLTEIKARVIDAVSSLLHLRVADQTEELLGNAENWYSYLDRNPLNLMMTQVKQPFLQLRSAAFNFLRVVANQPWGQRNLNNYATFHEYILDRSTEKSKEGKEAKFEVVKTLVESPTAMDIFGAPFFLKLREYYQDGPFYVQTETMVAFEGDT